MSMGKWYSLLCVVFALLPQNGLSINNPIPDLNKLTEPPEGAPRSPEDDEIWCHPEDVHLSYGNTSSDIVVMWATRGHCDSQVQYADHPWDLDQLANGTKLELEHAVNKSLRFMHRVVMTGLTPSTTYHYRPVTSSGVGTGSHYFKTPVENSGGWSPSFLVSNDLDSDSTTVKSVISEALSGKYSAIVYNGDLEEKLKPEEGKRDSMFLSNIEQATASLPFMTVPGKKVSEDGEDGLYLYQYTFSMPGMTWPMPKDKMWYSLNIGPVHVISYSTDVFFETDIKNAKAQQEWLVKDLTEINKKRSETPWVIAVGSQPMYCSFGTLEANDCATNSSKVRHGLEDLFYFFGVDLVINGRHKVYERTWPQYKGVVITKSYDRPRAPVEVMLGLQQEEVMVEDSAGNENITTPVAAEWTAFHLSDSTSPSYGRLSVLNMTHSHWELLSSTDKSVLDDFWIVQDNHGNFSLATLPHNISHQINQSIIAMGGKPGTYDFIDGSTGNASDGEGWSKYSLWLGLGVVAAVLVLVLGMVAIRTCMRRKRARAGRRWREVDRSGSDGGNFYSVASDSDTDDNDFEIDMFDKTNKPSSKLLTSY